MINKVLHNRLISAILYLGLLITACAPAAQIVPTPTPIPGWQKISNEGFEIWLPENFMAGTNLNLDAVAQEMAKLGPDFEQLANNIALKKTSLLIFAFDKNRDDTGLVTNLGITKEAVPSNSSVETYIETLGYGLKEPFEVSEKRTLPSDRYTIGILIVNVNTPRTGKVTQIMYAIKNGGAIWQVVFTTPADEFQEQLPVFERIVRTANVPYTRETVGQAYEICCVTGIALIVISFLFSLLRPWLSRLKKQKAETP